MKRLSLLFCFIASNMLSMSDATKNIVNEISKSNIVGKSDVAMNFCNEINQISPDASPALFTQLALKLKQAGLSTCTCIMALNNKRAANAMSALKKEWDITDENMNNIHNFYEKSFQEDMQPNGLEFIPAIVTNKQGEREQCTIAEHKFMMKRFIEAGYLNNKIKLNFVAPSMLQVEDQYVIRLGGTAISRYIQMADYPIDHEAQRLKYEILKPAEVNINIGRNYMTLNKEGRKGLLLHEIYGHALFRDIIIVSLLWLNAAIKRPDLLKNRELFFSSESAMADTCAREARADQFPAACFSVKNSRFIESWFKQAYDRDQQASDGELLPNKTHGDIKDRLAMATRIRKLKEAEEQIQQDVATIKRFATFIKKDC